MSFDYDLEALIVNHTICNRFMDSNKRKDPGTLVIDLTNSSDSLDVDVTKAKYVNQHVSQWITLKKRKTTNDNLSNESEIKPNYVFDILYDESTAKECIKQYKDSFDLPELSDDVQEKLKSTLIRVTKQKLWTSQQQLSDQNELISLSLCKIGDMVKVSYHPCSQKYIDYYESQSFTGRIIFIDCNKDNAFFLIDDKNTIIIKSLEREGCHFMGMTRGYDYLIESI